MSRPVGVFSGRGSYKTWSPEEKRVYQNEWRAKNHSKVLARQRLFYHKKRLQDHYGLTVSDYWQIIAAQGGGCAICGKTRDIDRCLAVDHSHGTGKVRGVLCSRCNRGIGNFKDDAALLRKAAAYLED